MSSPVKSFRLLLLTLTLLLFQSLSYSQSICSCPEFEILKADQEKSGTDNKPAQQKLLTLSNTICKAKSYEWMALDYSDEKIFDTAEIYFQKAEKIYKQSACGDSVLLITYKKWAELYYIKGDFAKSQDYTFKLLQSAEAMGSPYEQAGCFTMIAQLLNQTAQADKGIIYARKAIPFLNKIESPSHAADILFKLSKRYLWYYQDTKTLSSLDSSELFSQQQLIIAKSINKKTSIALAFSNLEGIEWEREDFKKALQFLDSSFKYSNPGDHATLASNYYDKADLLIELKNYNEAEQMADSAMYYYKITGNVPYIAETYELISRIAREKGDYKKAFEANELARAITDSVRNVEKTKQVTELERKYNQAKNEQTIKELAQQKQIYLLFAVAGLLAAVAIGFFLRQQSLKHKQKILETEQRLNRARMNPHFFFNALASLQSFALRENDGKALASNLSKFSHIMRETLESTYKEYVTIEQEMDFLREYLSLQQIRFPDKFSYEVNADNNLEMDELVIPSMIIQPFVENSIEHGFAGINYPGHVRIFFRKENNELQIEVTDNGKGLLTTAKQNLPAGQAGNEHISRASQIIKDRIYLLNIKLKTKAGFLINNNEDSKGVIVKIHLPVLHKENIKT